MNITASGKKVESWLVTAPGGRICEVFTVEKAKHAKARGLKVVQGKLENMSSYDEWVYEVNKIDVQLVFNKVILAGFYGEHTSPHTEARPLMCKAVKAAWVKGVINRYEKRAVDLAIGQYLTALAGSRAEIKTTLKEALLDNNLACEFDARLAIFSDWHNRPKAGKMILNNVVTQY